MLNHFSGSVEGREWSHVREIAAGLSQVVRILIPRIVLVSGYPLQIHLVVPRQLDQQVMSLQCKWLINDGGVNPGSFLGPTALAPIMRLSVRVSGAV